MQYYSLNIFLNDGSERLRKIPSDSDSEILKTATRMTVDPAIKLIEIYAEDGHLVVIVPRPVNEDAL